MGLQQERTPEPQIIVIFGASGDHPAQASFNYKMETGKAHLETTDRVARRDWSHDYFREHMREGIEQVFLTGSARRTCGRLAPGLFYCPGDIDNQKAQKLKVVGRVGREAGALGNRVFTFPLPRSSLQSNPAARAAGMTAVRPAQDSPEAI